MEVGKMGVGKQVPVVFFSAKMIRQCSVHSNELIMGIDLATWRARIGLNYYYMCRPLQTRWIQKSSGSRVYQPGVVSWGVGEVMSTSITVVALSLVLMMQHHVVHSYSKPLKGRGKARSHEQATVSQVRWKVGGGGTLLLRAIVVVIPLLLVIAGDVETNPGPGGNVVLGGPKLR